MRLVDVDRLKDILEYGILCNVPADAVNTEEEKLNDWIQEVVDKAPTVEAIPKDQYETRLKADMVAMLTDIQLEIEELKSYESADGQDLVMLADIGILFQQKIDALKAESEDNK